MTRLVLTLILATLTLALPAKADAAEDECQALFVHSARNVAMDAGTIVMKGVSPVVIYFCDRPVRMAGHLSIEEFLSSVSSGKDNFAENPPNAVLSVVSGDEIVDVVVELAKKPTVNGDELTYSDVRIIEGEAPQTAGAGSLFIDIIGRPRSPMSIGGVHRRHVRHAMRRCAAGVTCY